MKKINFSVEIEVPWEDFPSSSQNIDAEKDIENYIKMFMKQLDVIPLCVRQKDGVWIKDSSEKVNLKIKKY